MSSDLPSIARKYALLNAVKHGEADAKSCMGAIMGAHPEFRAQTDEVMQALQAAVAEVNSMDSDARQAALESEAPELRDTPKRERTTGLKPLPNAEKGKVVLRFAPNPNGPLSLGHARGVAIMAQYADEYDGDVVLRFDDTDPQVKPPLYIPRKMNAYRMILDDFRWLAGRAPDRVVMASNRIRLYQRYAVFLIKRGGAYVCTCDAEAWRDLKNNATPCSHRDMDLQVHLQGFQRMMAGDYRTGEAVLRVKTDIAHPDPALRDWAAFRIVSPNTRHPRHKTRKSPTHHCWPLLDFESAVEDHLQGVTHIIRGKDLMDSTKKQAYLYEHMDWEYPETVYWGRISIHEFGKFSTSAMRRGIEDGTYEGWDDPRLPTIRALQRRGYSPAAVRRFWIGLGISEKDIAISLENMDGEDAKNNEEAPRFFFVPDPQEVEVDGIDGKTARPMVHPSHPDQGHRTIPASSPVLLPGGEVTSSYRLKDLGNVDDGVFTGTEMDRGRPILQWLPKSVGVPFKVLRPRFLEEGEKGDADDVRLERIHGVIEPAALDQVGKVVQFERFGFVMLESKDQGVWLHD